MRQVDATELLALHEWMREPDWAENFSLEDMANWINRRPTHTTARLIDPAQAAWMPIETAPKDKTTILIAGGEFEWSNSMHGWMKAEGVSMASYDESEKCWRGENSGGHDEYYWHKPTHWMPLPTPPLSSTDYRCTCGGDPDQPAGHHDISCPLALSSTNGDTP